MVISMGKHNTKEHVCYDRSVIVVDSYAGGISMGRVSQSDDAISLALGDVDGVSNQMLRSRYLLEGGEPVHELERALSRLSRRGELRRATVVFGNTTDPFHPFDEKFATSMKFLQLFERFVPGRIVIQTRSPLIVIGIPALKRVRKNTFITMGIETDCDEVAKRYMPNMPLISERLKAIRTLRHFGMRVGIQVSPLLPYGDWRADAKKFASLLDQYGDFIHLHSLSQLAHGGRPKGYAAQKLASERCFHWLRPDAHRPLLQAVRDTAPQKLLHPVEYEFSEPQLALFSAQKGLVTSVSH